MQSPPPSSGGPADPLGPDPPPCSQLWLAFKHLVEAIGLSIVTRKESTLVSIVIVLVLYGLVMGLLDVFRLSTGINLPLEARHLASGAVARVHAALAQAR